MKTFSSCIVVLALALSCGSGTVTPQDGGAGGGSGGGVAGGSGGGGTGGGSVPDGGLPLAVACQTLVAKRCDYLVRCQLLSDEESARRDCAAYFGATWCGPSKWPSRVGSPVATLKYDPSVAQACADAFATRSCNEWKDVPLACSRFLLPNVLMGQACYGSGYTECIEGVCRGASCPRTCQARGAAGGVCSLNGDCVTGLYCKRNPGIAGLGQCSVYGTTQSACSSTDPCGTGLTCVAGKCVAPPSAGSPCLGSVCDDNAFCVAGADGGLCSARRGADAGCTDDVQCQSGLLCDSVLSSCVAKMLSQAGAVCSLRQECPSGTVCGGANVSLNGTCQNPAGPGQSCISSVDCQASLRCGAVDGGRVCGPRISTGTSCQDDRDCQELAMCLSSSCTRLPLTGEACEVTKKCAFGPCVQADAGWVCGAPKGPGSSCQVDGDCASGRCASGQCLTDCVP